MEITGTVAPSYDEAKRADPCSRGPQSPVWVCPNGTGVRNNPSVTEKTPPVSPERAARNGRIVMAICIGFFGLFAAGLGAYAVHSYRDYAVRTSPPGGQTTEVVVDEVTTGRYCASNGQGSNCSPEYTLSYAVDGTLHTTTVRIHLHTGDQVHAFEGSDGHWYVTEDPGFGNSRVAWMIWSAAAVGSFFFALLCLRSWLKIPKPT
jgi:hypothetical protein